MTELEKKLLNQGYKYIAGVDEAGRGPLAGPVVAACCIYHKDLHIEGINDSKQLTADQRRKIFSLITKNPAIIYGIGIVDVAEIDKINILQATLYAMKKAIEALITIPDFVLIDGNQIPDVNIPCEAVVKGDELSISIAAASVIAKFTRDEIMDQYHEVYPEYGFNQHKGYGTKKHLDALNKFGSTPIHRITFKPCSLVPSREENIVKI